MPSCPHIVTTIMVDYSQRNKSNLRETVYLLIKRWKQQTKQGCFEQLCEQEKFAFEVALGGFVEQVLESGLSQMGPHRTFTFREGKGGWHKDGLCPLALDLQLSQSILQAVAWLGPKCRMRGARRRPWNQRVRGRRPSLGGQNHPLFSANYAITGSSPVNVSKAVRNLILSSSEIITKSKYIQCVYKSTNITVCD